MKTVSTNYHNKKQLETFIESNNLKSAQNVLIQIFTSEGKVRVSRLRELISRSLPQASIIGATVDASFCSEIKTSGTAVSFTCFDKVQVKSIGVSYEESMIGHEIGIEIGTRIIKRDTKAVIIFGSSQTHANKGMLKALEERYPNVVVAGGNSVPIGEKNIEFLVSDDRLIDSGVTAVSLSGDELTASVHACSDWNTVGRSFTVTKAENTRVYSLNGTPVKDVYEKYLGTKMIMSIADSRSLYPLMVTRGDHAEPVMMKNFNQDGSIEALQPIPEGAKVSIGCGDAGNYLDSLNFVYQQLKNRPVEELFLYSCLSRRRFFNIGVAHEMETIRNIVPSIGAFTAGEYYHEDGRNDVLSYALTFLTLAEYESYIDEQEFLQAKKPPIDYQEMLAMSQLVKASTEDLEELNDSLMMAEEKISHLAYHDSLTGLPNRVYFHERLGEAIGTAKQMKEKLAVMVVDLDEFKMINDSLGHQAGDRILKHVSRNMNGMIQEGQFLARFAADEFLIFIPKANESEKILSLAKNILSVIKKPILLNGKEYVLSGSIGISLYPTDAADDVMLLKNANLAMHRAKLEGRSSVQFFTMEMDDSINERLEMENHLRKAMVLGEFELFYQPQINISDEEVFACEALLRWNHTKQGMIPPNVFIPIAEEAGLINEIGKWVLDKACKQAKKWHNQGLKALSVCVNVSGKQFQRVEFVDEVKESLRVSGLNASSLHIELTESIMLEDVEHSLWTINQLRNLGVKISVDDFGTGYSSLSYLRDFPIDILKIDQSFIRNLDEFNSDAAIVRAIITMCEGLNVTVLAEGVETRNQLLTLKNFGCDQVQGYYISKPVRPSQIDLFLTGNKII
ncbi:bifunctional diguanylate cyclase/phosphodiesterase [Pseudalkalibacillus salsuginis]|uniref:bifunctional diguanylate cyclase/phosphodiesterase n=1 Tax=Pseudalkalibacillus salsuginis TaxID=2910972 RepID=UPI001F45424C|nr:EAL domain-containing protein [Pseudalkalibacillus salsuginis]MCF6409260.1 EAL domain-containing protein [Pseudalkalibacillus salsuginis]